MALRLREARPSLGLHPRHPTNQTRKVRAPLFSREQKTGKAVSSPRGKWGEAAIVTRICRGTTKYSGTVCICPVG